MYNLIIYKNEKTSLIIFRKDHKYPNIKFVNETIIFLYFILEIAHIFFSICRIKIKVKKNK